MYILVTYDVNTTTNDGKRRLRRVATICKNYGQRVQYSVFECHVSPSQKEELEHKLRKVIDEESDSIRIYRLPANRDDSLTTYGLDEFTDFDDPLIF